jgi:energy-coupling factor transporter ATP-binding protein EcfA2
MYFPPYSNLEYPTHDAEQVAQVLEQYGQFEVERLPKRLNPETGQDEVAKEELTGYDLGQALRRFLLEKAKGSDALIYYSGHGITVPNNLGQNEGYIVTSDCGCGTVSKDGIALDRFNDLISEADLKSLVVLLDCCHAGYFLERNLIKQTLSIFSRKTDCFLIAACRSNEKSHEGALYGGEHGVFTNALLEGLSQKNAGDDGEIRTDELFSFISRKLELRNKKIPFKPQEAIRISSGCSLTLVSYPPKPTPPLPDDTCPYQGLQSFDKKQARFFFGRRKVIETLRQKLDQANFVPVIGPSGSGKSSVVRAGLIPGLEENGWRVLNPILPGSEPLEKLKQAFSQLVEQPEDVQTIASLIDTAPNLQPVIDKLPDSERLLLVVDQFEEVFTLCQKQEERRQFINLLTQVAEIPASQLAIVTTMRADFVESCLSYPSLTQLIQQNQPVWLMPFLEGSDLEQAIVKPTEIQGYSFEDGLLGAIMQDVGKEQGSLPLLQFALTELWEERDKQNHQLTLAKYNDLGRVIGALNRRAEKLYESFTEQQQDWVKRIFLRLVRTGEDAKDTRQRQPKQKLLALAGDKETNQKALSQVLDRLVNERLLVAGEEGWIDLAHETLMEDWQRFAQWRQENQPLRRLIDRVEDALRIWQEEPKDENLLPRGLLAQTRQRWQELEPDLDATAREFYWKSDANEQHRSTILQQEAEAILREKAARVLDLLPTKPVEGLVLAIQATGLSLEKLRGEVHSAVSASLHRAVEIAREQNIFVGNILKNYAFAITSVAFSPDGQYIVSGSEHGILLQDLKGNLIPNAFLGHKKWVNCVAFSPNGEYIVSGGDDETVRLWDLKGNQIGQPFRGHNANVTAVAFSPDNQCIVSGGKDEMVRVWNLQGQQIISPLHGLQDWISCVSFSPDGQYVAACGEDEYQCIKLWNRKDYQLSNSFQDCGWIDSIAFSPDSQYLISGDFDDSLQLWNLEGHLIGEPFKGHEDVVTCVAFSPDGKYIVSGSRDKTIRLWDLEGNQINDPFGEHEDEVNSVAFSPDGHCIVSGSDDRTLRLWDVKPLPGDDWETLLQAACDRLRYHPVFKNPQTEVEKQGCETCRKYVWDK